MEQLANHLLWLKSRGLNSVAFNKISIEQKDDAKVLVLTSELDQHCELLTAILRSVNLNLSNVMISSQMNFEPGEKFSHIISFGVPCTEMSVTAKIVESAPLSMLDDSKDLKRSLWQDLLAIKGDFIN
jgi:DNA polymerase III psi subunit